MLYYDRIGIGDEIDPTKSNKSRDCMICHYFLFNHEFKFQDSLCNGCHDMTSFNISDIVIITLKNVDYSYIIYNISNYGAINLLKIRGYILKILF